MSKRIAHPFLTLSDNAIKDSVWEISVDGGEFARCDYYLEGWDYSADIEIRYTLTLDMITASIDLGIPEPQLDLEVFIQIGTGQGRFPQRIIHTERSKIAKNGDLYTCTLSLSGRNLSKRLYVLCNIITASTPKNFSIISPKEAGLKVWTEIIDISLEGLVPRFPMESASFSKSSYAKEFANAPWLLSWNPTSLDEDFQSSVRLYLNTDKPSFLKRFIEKDPEILQAALADTIIQILTTILYQSDPENLLDNSEPNTLAAHASNWLNIAFPDIDLNAIIEILKNQPGKFNAAIYVVAEIRSDI